MQTDFPPGSEEYASDACWPEAKWKAGAQKGGARAEEACAECLRTDLKAFALSFLSGPFLASL